MTLAAGRPKTQHNKPTTKNKVPLSHTKISTLFAFLFKLRLSPVRHVFSVPREEEPRPPPWDSCLVHGSLPIWGIASSIVVGNLNYCDYRHSFHCLYFVFTLYYINYIQLEFTKLYFFFFVYDHYPQIRQSLEGKL